MPGFSAAAVEAAVGLGGTVAVGAGDSKVTGIVAPGLAIGDCMTGGCNPGLIIGAAGSTGAAGVGKVPAGVPTGGTAGDIPGGGGEVVGTWPKEVSASAVAQKQVVSSVFINYG